MATAELQKSSDSFPEGRLDEITLRPAERDDMEILHKMQVEAFSELLEKYRDYDTNPACESLGRVLEKFGQPWTRYFFILFGEKIVGGVRVIDKGDGGRKRISPIWIEKGERNKGHAQKAMKALEEIYGARHWSLETILEEKANLHLYEKLGYRQTGKIEKISENMTIVFLEKD